MAIIFYPITRKLTQLYRQIWEHTTKPVHILCNPNAFRKKPKGICGIFWRPESSAKDKGSSIVSCMKKASPNTNLTGQIVKIAEKIYPWIANWSESGFTALLRVWKGEDAVQGHVARTQDEMTPISCKLC